MLLYMWNVVEEGRNILVGETGDEGPGISSLTSHE